MIKLSQMYRILSIALAFTIVLGQIAYALPTDPTVENGTATIEVSGNTMTINASDKAVINYSSFNVGASESLVITLPNASSSILNRDMGGNISSLAGMLQCNGLFILINPSGIYVAPTASINVGSVVLSTRDINTQEFLNNNLVFRKITGQELDTLLVNAGTINISKGGFGVLIAGAVENKGTIVAPVGKIHLASGDAVRLDMSGDGLISVAIEEKVASTIYDYQGRPITEAIKNSGSLSAKGGVVVLSEDAVTGIFAKAVNLEGHVSADSFTVLASGTVQLCVEVDSQVMLIRSPKTELVGEDPYYFHGDATIDNFECTTAGRQLYFEALRKYTFKESLRIEGTDGGYNVIYLKSSRSGTPWYIDIQAGTYTLSKVCVGDSYNVNPGLIYASPSSTAGDNMGWNLNTVYWTGAAGDGKWSTAGNWTGGIPKDNDVEFVSDYDPEFDASVVDADFADTIKSLKIRSDAGHAWTGSFTFANSLAVSSGNVDMQSIGVGINAANVAITNTFAGGYIEISNWANTITTPAGGTALAVSTKNGAVSLGNVHGTGHTDITITTENAGAYGNVFLGQIGNNGLDAVHKVAVNDDPALNSTGEVHLYGDITTKVSAADNSVILKGHVKLENDVTIDTSANNGSVVLDKSVEGVGSNRFLKVNAKTGVAGGSAYFGVIGSDDQVLYVDITGAEIHLYGDITTSNAAGNNVSLTGAVKLEDNVTIDTDAAANAGTITITGTVDGAKDLALDSGTADITVSGAIGGISHLNDLTITKANTVDFAGAITLDGDFTLTSGAVTQNAAVAIAGDYTLSGGTFTDSRAAPSPGDFTVGGSFSITGGTFDRYGDKVGDYYMVRDVYDLQAIACGPGSKYKLNGDVDALATDSWNPAGAIYNGFNPIINFAGTLDGDGYAIQDLYINRPYNGNIGLFADTIAGSSISDLDLTDIDVTGLKWVGSLVGNNYATITNCSASGAVTGLATEVEASCTGGLIGNNFGDISGSSAAVAVSASSYDVGGLVGYNDGGSITDSHATGNVTSTLDTVGGLVGYNLLGTITSSSASGIVTGKYAVGGLVGWNNIGLLDTDPALSPIIDSWATGKVIGLAGYYNVGGLVGYNNGAISGSHATGNVEGWDTVGGLVGCNGGDGSAYEHPNGPVGAISDSYATGNVTGHNSVGGLVGWNNEFALVRHVTVSDSHSEGDVTGSGNNIGGLAGYDSGTTTNSYATGTATLSGTDQTIETSCIYGNLTKTTPGSITFVSGTLQTVAGTLTLTGSANNFIKLRSGTPGNEWQIDPQGTRSVSYVDVQDSKNANAAKVTANNSVDSGNNTNWTIIAPAPQRSESNPANLDAYERDTTPGANNPGPAIINTLYPSMAKESAIWIAANAINISEENKEE